METEDTEGATTRGKYKWYFSSGVDPKDVEKRDKLRQNGRRNKAVGTRSEWKLVWANSRKLAE